MSKGHNGHFTEDVEVSGHIIDSLILPKVLDLITESGGQFCIKRMNVGHARNDPSYALVEVQADSPDRLASIIAEISDHGAVPTVMSDARMVPADVAGAFPEGFYSTTNQKTEIRIDKHWIEVQDQ